MKAVDAQAVVPGNAKIISSQRFTEPVAYSRLDGYVETGDPGPNRVNFQISLPDAFCGRYIMVSQGGAAGTVPRPPADLLAAGWAVASTDKGTRPADPLDFSWVGDPAQAKDYGGRATHEVTITTQRIVRAYYRLEEGPGSLYRYIIGCSGGGISGQSEAEHYPEDYDGVVAAALPSTFNAWLYWGAIFQRVARNADAWVSPAELNRIQQLVVERWAYPAGDVLVWDPSVIEFDPATINFLTPAQIDTIRLLVDGFHPPANVSSSWWDLPGFDPSTATEWSSLLGREPSPKGSTESGPLSYRVMQSTSQGFFGADYDYITQFDFSSAADVRSYQTALSAAMPEAMYNPRNLTRFRDRGGKLIWWVGAGDYTNSAGQHEDYYDQSVVTFGGYNDTASFFRLFVAPGTSHCSGGPGPQDCEAQSLAALTSWVEDGKAPDSLVTHSCAAASTQRSFLLCPYPNFATFQGGAGKDVNDASHWRRK
jgi:hypothetical protein